MSELQDKLNQILSNPEALKQVQSLGAQLGLTQNSEPPPKPAQSKPPQSQISSDMMGAFAKIAPMLGTIQEDDTSRLLHSLRPFLSEAKQRRLDQAEKMLKILKIMPLIKNSGLF